MTEKKSVFSDAVVRDETTSPICSRGSSRSCYVEQKEDIAILFIYLRLQYYIGGRDGGSLPQEERGAGTSRYACRLSTSSVPVIVSCLLAFEPPVYRMIAPDTPVLAARRSLSRAFLAFRRASFTYLSQDINIVKGGTKVMSNPLARSFARQYRVHVSTLNLGSPATKRGIEYTHQSHSGRCRTL